MSTALSLEGQAALDLHKIMLEAMRARESEILRFIGFFLTAIAGFIAAAGLLTDKDRIVYAELLMPMLFGIIILILFCGAWYALALSYNYRYIQLSTWLLQKHLKVTRFQPDWEPKKFQSERLKFFGFAPEILRTQIWLYVALIIVAVIFLSAFAWHRGHLTSISFNSSGYLGVFLETILSLWIIRLFGYRYYPEKYNKRHDEASKKTGGDDPVFQCQPLSSMSGGTQMEIKGIESLRKQVKDFSPTFYITLISIIASLALGYLLSEIDFKQLFGPSWNLLYYLKISVCFCAIVITWHEYAMSAALFRWVLSYIDSLLPFLFGTALFAMMKTINLQSGDTGLWFYSLSSFTFVGSLAYLNQFYSTRKEEENSSLLKTAMKYYHPISIGASLICTVIFLVFGKLAERYVDKIEELSLIYIFTNIIFISYIIVAHGMWHKAVNKA